MKDFLFSNETINKINSEYMKYPVNFGIDAKHLRNFCCPIRVTTSYSKERFMTQVINAQTHTDATYVLH
jgi:hypothetical protein